MNLQNLLPEIQPLLADDRLNELGPGAANLAARPLLQELERQLPKIAKDRDFASACLAGLWLRHDFLDESHTISQALGTVEGSYWHALMHRREPDYWNSKYWFRRVGVHPIFEPLREATVAFASGQKWPSMMIGNRWDPAAFVDLCEQNANPTAPGHKVCVQVQRLEWRLLFAYCHERAFTSVSGLPK